MDHHPFIFDWSRPPKWESNWRLMVLIFVSLVGHVAVFYLFQVSYPRIDRWSPRTRGVMLLSSVDPISAQVLRELDDRTFHLQGAGASEVPAYSLNKMSPKFRPSFLGHEVALKAVPAPVRDESLPLLYQPGVVELPPLPDRPVQSPAVPGTTPVAFVEIRAGLEGETKGWTAQVLPALREELASSPEAWRLLRLRVSVGSDGVIRNLLTEAVDEGTVSPRYLEKVRQSVRFKPGPDRRWGWMELRR